MTYKDWTTEELLKEYNRLNDRLGILDLTNSFEAKEAQNLSFRFIDIKAELKDREMRKTPRVIPHFKVIEGGA